MSENVTGISPLSLKDLSSWRVPAYAQEILYPESVSDIQKIIKSFGPKIHLLGYGSNTLLPSDRCTGTVMVLKKNFSNMERLGEEIVLVDAGYAAPKIARWSWGEDYHNLSFLAGIPGSIGGSVMMNAGAHQRAIMEEVLWLEVIDRQGTLHQLGPKDYSYQYRQLNLPFPGVVSRVALRLRQEPSPLSVKEVLQYRARTQPLGQWTCGSVFKNPPGFMSAGWLIEQVGLKGFRDGDLEISAKHANFIVNHQSASATQILKLTRWIQERVYALTGAILEPEYQCLRPLFEDRP